MQLTLEDYIEYNQTFHRRNKSTFVKWGVPCVFGALFGGMSIFMENITAKGGFIIFMTIMGFILGLMIFRTLPFLLSITFGNPLIIYFSKRKYKKLKSLQNEYTIIVNDSGVETMSSETKTFVVWNRILKVLENEKAYYLFISNTVAFILLKRYVESMEEMVFLQTQINKNIPSSKIKFFPLR